MTDTPPIEPPSAEEPPPVEIHKPKPVHSWREFLTELGTIVLGICIAITLEQLVESWRWDREVSHARNAIHAEIAADNVNFPQRRLAYKPCLDRQVREAEAILADLEAHRPPGRFTSFHTTNGGPTTDGEWQSQRASQTLTHFPEDELAMMTRYYSWLSDFKDWNAAEAQSWIDLSGLRNPPAGLGPADFMRLHADLAAVRRYEGLIELNSIRVLNISEALGAPRIPMNQGLIRLFCTTNEEEYTQHLRDSEASQR
jgi:hypothetical protein